MHRLPIALSVVCVFSACIERPLDTVTPKPATEVLTEVSLDKNRDFDILFVIDNSRSMQTEQASLAANFPRIIAALDDPDVGLPSIHIGVITTDVGAGATCDVNLQAGNMVGTGCGGLMGPYIADIANDDGSRSKNYTDTMANTFSCMADVGINGCGFEQPLESMKRALNGNVFNNGFIRDHAYLAVIFVTDEDDCSARDDSMFAADYVDLSHPLGPHESFRCFEFGVTCEGADLRSPGVKENCVSDDDSAYMRKIAPYIDFLKGVKQYDEQLFVAAISGSLTPVEVRHLLDPTPHSGQTPVTIAEVKPSCENGNADAVPPIRLNGFLTGFPTRNKLTSICNEDLTDSVEEIVGWITNPFIPCIVGELADVDPTTPELDVECTVSEVRADRTERVLSSCETTSALPCYTLKPTNVCSSQATGLGLEVTYEPGFTVPPGTRAVARCLGK